MRFWSPNGYRPESVPAPVSPPPPTPPATNPAGQLELQSGLQQTREYERADLQAKALAVIPLETLTERAAANPAPLADELRAYLAEKGMLEPKAHAGRPLDGLDVCFTSGANPMHRVLGAA